MRLLVTGGRGMVGSNVREALSGSAHRLLAPPREELDLIDLSCVKEYLASHKIDMIIHAAGKIGGIKANIANMEGFLFDNLLVGLNLVEAAKCVGVERMINLGSSCMYPRARVEPLSEDMILDGEPEPTNEGYALAKIVVQRLCGYVSEKHGLQYKTLIPCNLYGKWDKFDPQHSHMIPGVIRRLHEAKENGTECVEIWGDGTARREFMYAGDLADCLVRAIEDFENLPAVMNVGLGFDCTINEYYEVISAVVGYKGEFEHDFSKPVGMRRKLLDVSRQKDWGWQSETPLKDGVEKTYEFFVQEYLRSPA